MHSIFIPNPKIGSVRITVLCDTTKISHHRIKDVKNIYYVFIKVIPKSYQRIDKKKLSNN